LPPAAAKIRLSELCGSSRTAGLAAIFKNCQRTGKILVANLSNHRLEPHFVKENFSILFDSEILGNFCFLFVDPRGLDFFL